MPPRHGSRAVIVSRYTLFQLKLTVPKAAVVLKGGGGGVGSMKSIVSGNSLAHRPRENWRKLPIES